MKNVTNDEKALLFDKILDRFSKGEPIQDEWDLYAYISEWLKEIRKEIDKNNVIPTIIT